MKTQKGFTLIELMMTVAIVGTLASVAIPSFMDYVAKAKLTRVSQEAKSVETALYDYLTDWGTFGAHYQGHSSIHMNQLNNQLQQVVDVIEEDSNFVVKKIWSGQCTMPGVTVHMMTSTGSAIRNGGAVEFYVRYDLTGKYMGISPAPWGPQKNRASAGWWPNTFFGYATLDQKVKSSNDTWTQLCTAP